MNETVIQNKYKIEKEIGKGKFGTVYKGCHMRTKQHLAIKMESSEATVRILKHETTILNYLYNNGSRCIPVVFWFGLTPEPNQQTADMNCSQNSLYNTYLIMTYYPCTLYDYLKHIFPKKNLDTLQTIRHYNALMGKCIDILENIHSYYVVHRDIKPQNFMMGADNDIYLIDFGLANIYVDDEKKHIVCNEEKRECIIGTPKYMSHYIHEGIEPVRRDDLISLGYMYMYFCLGSLPWDRLWIQTHDDFTDCGDAAPQIFPEIHIFHPKNRFIQQKKKWENLSLECSQINHEITRYMNYCYHLKFEAAPEYKALHQLFV